MLRDASARRAEGVFVLEGPRVIAASLDREAHLDAAYFGLGAEHAFAPLRARLDGAGVRLVALKEGVLERIGTTVTPQPVLAVASLVTVPLEQLPTDGFVLVAVGVADPGNAGTVLRSAEAGGAAGVVFCGNSVDPHNPKVVRASAGAIFGVTVVEADDPVEVLDALGAQGRRRLGTRASGGDRYDAVDLTRPVAIVLGNEARGLAGDLPLDGDVSIPMAGKAESINVAMAATVLCFEAERQRRARDGEAR